MGRRKETAGKRSNNSNCSPGGNLAGKFLLPDGDQEGPCPAECPLKWGRPVCASDGKLYPSSCAFQRARCQEPDLEAWPRFRCAGRLSQRDNNYANFTRCQEDRAAALAKSRQQGQATFVPECSEDGAFLQVQCYKETGYCWCSSPEGKPVSGTSVLNETPNCTDVVVTSGQDFNSSRQEEGARSQPTQPSPRPPKQEGGTSLPFLIPIILPELKPNPTVKQTQASPPSCEEERRAGLREARQQEGTFIPECEGDGTYKEVQCHQATGYCWCVRADTGRSMPGTSTRKFPPDCAADEAAAKSAEMGFLFRNRVLPGCPRAKKAKFLVQLIQAFVSHMLRSRVMTIPYQRFPDSLAAPSLNERAVRWKFAHLDRDFSNSLSGQELRPLKLYLKHHARPKRCVRHFLDYCDLNSDTLISLPEFRGCLGLS